MTNLKSARRLPDPGRGGSDAQHGLHAMRGFELLDGAGHWVQQEQPERVSALILRFLQET